MSKFMESQQPNCNGTASDGTSLEDKSGEMSFASRTCARSTGASIQPPAKRANSFFQSVYTNEARFLPPSTEELPTPSVSDKLFSEGIVRRELEALNESKSPGPDEIPPKLLKELASELSVPLSMLFQTSFDTGTLPIDWKLALITPLYKGELDPSSRRQARGLHSLHRLPEGVRHRVPPKAPTKTEKIGIGGNFLKWIENLLLGRHQVVCIGQGKSDPAMVESGVPQGFVLGPTLFLIYVDDAARALDCEVAMIADDMKIWSPSHGSSLQKRPNADQRAMQKNNEARKMLHRLKSLLKLGVRSRAMCVSDLA
ncbi:hypothetical protein SprV_0401674300 [Sparganum proliferum]